MLDDSGVESNDAESVTPTDELKASAALFFPNSNHDCISLANSRMPNTESADNAKDKDNAVVGVIPTKIRIQMPRAFSGALLRFATYDNKIANVIIPALAAEMGNAAKIKNAHTNNV